MVVNMEFKVMVKLFSYSERANKYFKECQVWTADSIQAQAKHLGLSAYLHQREVEQSFQNLGFLECKTN